MWKKEKLGLSEYYQIDKEVEPFRVKTGDPKQVAAFKQDGRDITGFLLTDGYWKWMALRKAVSIDDKGRHSVIVDKDGNAIFSEMDHKFEQYIYMKDLEKKGKFKKPKSVEIEINADDIPF